jgi:hypothetical protein
MLVAGPCLAIGIRAQNPVLTIVLVSISFALPLPSTIVGFSVVSEIAHASRQAAALSVDGGLTTLAGVHPRPRSPGCWPAPRAGRRGTSNALFLCAVVLPAGGLIALFGIRPERDPPT